MKCPKCHAEIMNDLQSCPFCGKELPPSGSYDARTSPPAAENRADASVGREKSSGSRRSSDEKSLLRRHILFTIVGAVMTIAGIVFNISLSIILGVLQLAFGIFGLVVFRKPDGGGAQQTDAENEEKKDPEVEKAISFAWKSGIVSLLGLIILNYRMIPLRAGVHTLVFFAVAALDIFLLVKYIGFQKRQADRNRIMKYAMIPIAILLVAGGLRVVYEIKAVNFRAQIPQDEMKITFSEKHEYHANSNIQYGSVNKKSELVFFFIDGKEYQKDSVAVIRPESGFQFEIRMAGTFNYTKNGYYTRTTSSNNSLTGTKTETIKLEPDSFAGGKYTTSITVPMKEEPGIYAVVTMTFARYDSFWEVLFS